MRRPIVVGNWKMHKTFDEAVSLATGVAERLTGVKTVDVVVCPPFPFLGSVARVLEASEVAVGAQDMHWENEGAYTGAVSPAMILTSGGTYTILGHSERRQFFGETDATVNCKLVAALAAGLAPIVCVGENVAEREANRVREVVVGQVRAALKGVPASNAGCITLAYEPVWAIGTGRAASGQQAQEVHALIRDCLSNIYGVAAAVQIRIQYGGSVKPDNAAAIFAQPDIDGALVGGSALDAASFAAIVQAAF